MVILTHNEILDIATKNKSGRYETQAALGNLNDIMTDDIGLVNFYAETASLRTAELQMIANTLDTLINKIKEFENNAK
jgi:hypothetical protein